MSILIKLRDSVTGEDASVLSLLLQKLHLQRGVGKANERSELFSTVSERSQGDT